MINPEILEPIFRRVAEKRLMKEIHEWIIYTAPNDVLEIYKEYLDTVNARDITIEEEPNVE